ncbi:RNA polymerase sigma factor [Fictibacillus nanhaiensis]|uniref:RNA polymerase sigma factor n=1 Tax=Fictibacillus nanhaiensis TaxID=742169 RepID=UPI001FE546F5|nr:sigma-70 family RNA polymerase sigma factor [Fictibacillus nanhaiensis]
MSGNEQAFRIFYEKYRPYLFRTIHPIAKTSEDTEEILQDVFLKIFHSLPEYQHQGLKTWMARIAVNKAIDFVRKKQRKPKEDGSEKEIYFIQGSLCQPEQAFFEKETRQDLHRKLEGVPQNYREVLTAFYLEDKSHREIAENQGVQEKTIEMKLYRARQWVKEHWKEDAK